MLKAKRSRSDNWKRRELIREDRAASGDGLTATVPEPDGKLSEMSNRQIASLPQIELVHLLQSSRPPFLSAEELAHSPFWDRSTLERVVFLARRCCQNRLH